MKKLLGFRKTINEVFLSSVKVATNGFHGGDAGHGSQTYIELSCPLGDMHFSVKEKGKSLQVEAAGDAELQTLIKTFKFMVEVLENKVEHQVDRNDSMGSFEHTPEPNSYLAEHLKG